MLLSIARHDLRRRRVRRLATRILLLVAVLAAACGGASESTAPDAVAPCVPPTGGGAPTYSALYATYFAAGTPGHCATAGCHLTGENGWTCGTSKEACYQGMVGVHLIDPATPSASILGNPRNSPLSWINPNGPMPQDKPGALPAGRDAILAWIAACAQND